MQRNYSPTEPLLMQFLLDAYQGHGCSVSRQGDWIIVEGGRLLTRAACFNKNHHPGVVILQVDFLTVTPAGEHILESFAGWGVDRQTALWDACQSFLDSTFHAVLSALLGHSSEQAETLLWKIGGMARKLTFGAVRMRGNFPTEAWPAVFDAIEDALTQSEIATGRHWVRYFYSFVPGQNPVIEALLDNEPWPAMQERTVNFPWPASDEFYSARVFAIMEDA